MARRTSPDLGRPHRILYASPGQKAELEAKNGLRQFDRVLELIREFSGVLHIAPETVKELHRLAIQGIYGCAGEFRSEFIGIDNSRHVPPNHRQVPALVDEMCQYANAHHGQGDETIHVAAYLLWRVNWIHPFLGGNGRTSRALGYLALSVGFNMELPGTNTVIDQIIGDRQAYYDALEAADEAWRDERVDVGKMESLVSDMLIRQLESGV